MLPAIPSSLTTASEASREQSQTQGSSASPDRHEGTTQVQPTPSEQVGAVPPMPRGQQVTAASQASTLPPGLPMDRPLTRQDFDGSPVLLACCGGLVAREHMAQAEEPAKHRDLYLVTDSRSRWENVHGDERKRTAGAIDLQQIRALIDALAGRLQQAAPTRVYGAFNYYPDAMTLRSNGALDLQPDHKNIGWHAFFEPLARLDYTARLDHAGCSMLLDGYTHQRHGREATAQERLALYEAKYLFDLLYYLYFLDIAFDTPASGTEAHIARPDALTSSVRLLPRLRRDQEALRDQGLPPLDISVEST